jgi:hypothetical protein
MLAEVFLPVLHNQMAFANREFSVINAMVAIGVFNNERAAFYEGLSHWLAYVPEYYYVGADGPEPRKPDFWLNSPSNDVLASLDAGLFSNIRDSWIYADTNPLHLGNDTTILTKFSVADQWRKPAAYIPGYSPETGGRDLGHAELAFRHTINVAEIARHQGIDLYTPYADRLTAFMEMTAALRLGVPADQRAYDGKLNPGDGVASSVYEIPYAHYHAAGMSLPNTERMLTTVTRKVHAKFVDAPFAPDLPAGIAARRIWGQEASTLTHGDLPQTLGP